MAFTEVKNLDSDTTISLGGIDKKTGKANPKQAEGYYLGSKKVESVMARTGFCYIHILSTADGNLGVWGKTDLDRKILEHVSPGTMVRITQIGMQKLPGKKDMYKFKVEEDKDNTIDVGALAADAEEGTADYDDSAENDQDLFEAEAAVDEVAPARATPPRKPVATTNASQQKVKELLNKRQASAV